MFPYHGYTGKCLYVDLTTGQIEPREYDPELAEQYLGGNGLGTRLLWEQVGPEVDPLSPENLLIYRGTINLIPLEKHSLKCRIISKHLQWKTKLRLCSLQLANLS